MYDAHLRYLAVAFVDAESVRPNQQEIADLLHAFSDLQLIPVAAQDASLSPLDRRTGFVSQDNAWQIVLFSKQFHVARVSREPLGEDMGEFSAFCEQANQILKWVLNRFERRPHRLAGVQEGLLTKKSDEELDAIGRRLLTVPETFKNRTLDEWDWRVVARISRLVGGRDELLNNIVSLKRFNGTVTQSVNTTLPPPLKPLPNRVPLIRADLDINTVQDNTSARFQPEHMDSFFRDVVKWQKDLVADINSFINLG
jgi:hypothetical protein